ncbi:MAG: hypothetical protein ACRC0Y_07830 [Fusobacteriaceae bacterium]
MRIELQILSAENGEIVIKETYITKAQYQYDTPDTALMKSNEINVKLIIEGNLERTISGEAKKLAQWSLMETGKDVYRIVKVIMRDNEEDIVREFELSKAFAVDYEETYENEQATFKLLVAQKRDEIEGVKVRDK